MIRKVEAEKPQRRAMLVDDSAVVREVLARALRARGIEVVAVHSAEMARERMTTWWPDVLVLDLELPGASGLEFLEELMRERPLPVVVCSGLAQPGAQEALRALALGAVEIVPKPDLDVRGFLESSGRSIADVVHEAAGEHVRPGVARRRDGGLRLTRRPAQSEESAPPVVIGASTGGVEAITTLLEALPVNAPPIMIVQHMPAGYTAAFAARLDGLCAMRVREAEEGSLLERGTALIAPGGFHVELQRRGGAVRVHLSRSPAVSGHRPSVDVLFDSAARTLGAHATGCVLTGMGSDGANGLLSMQRAGAFTIAQDEPTSVVYGMPRAAVARGGASVVLALGEIPFAITRSRATLKVVAAR